MINIIRTQRDATQNNSFFFLEDMPAFSMVVALVISFKYQSKLDSLGQGLKSKANKLN